MFWNNFDRFRFPFSSSLSSHLLCANTKTNTKTNTKGKIICQPFSSSLSSFTLLISSARRLHFWGKTFISAICKNPTKSNCQPWFWVKLSKDLQNIAKYVLEKEWLALVLQTALLLRAMCSRRLRQRRSQPRLCSSPPPSSAWDSKPASQLSEDELNGNWRKVVEPFLVVKHKEQSGQIRILTKLSAQSGSSYK